MALADSVTPERRDVAPLSLARRRTIAVVLFGVWTAFVWGGRVRNALGDAELSSSQRTWSLVLASIFIAVAVVSVVVAVVAARRPDAPALSRALVAVVAVASAWTVGIWVWRIVDIAAGGDHSAGFVLVHAVLAAVSIGLVSWALAASVAVARHVSIG